MQPNTQHIAEPRASQSSAVGLRPDPTQIKAEDPLPPFWKEVPDPSSGHKYYWNTQTNETTWQRPKVEPKVAQPTFASTDRSNAQIEQEPREEEKTRITHGDRDRDRGRDRDKGGNNDKGRGGRKRRGWDVSEDLDPMDPSAYADVPRGGWSSSGVSYWETGTKAADTTAGGPLFQQRPYPSPGTILRKQAQK